MVEGPKGVGKGEQGPAIGSHIESRVIGRWERVTRELEDIVDVVGDRRIAGGNVIGSSGSRSGTFGLNFALVVGGGLFAFGFGRLRREVAVDEEGR